MFKVDRPGGHAEPEESLKLVPESERKVNIEIFLSNDINIPSFKIQEGKNLNTIRLRTSLRSLSGENCLSAFRRRYVYTKVMVGEYHTTNFANFPF